jgi:hypothetical protein
VQPQGSDNNMVCIRLLQGRNHTGRLEAAGR